MRPNDGGPFFPSKQDDREGATLLEYFMAHAPFDLRDVPVTEPGADPLDPPRDLTDDDRLRLLVNMRYDYAVRSIRKSRGGNER